MAGDRLPTTIAVVITVLWASSVVLDAAWSAYDPPVTLHLLMTTVAGWAFGERYLRRKDS